MAIKFNPLVISNLANRFASVFNNVYIYLRLYPSTVSYSSAALPVSGALSNTLPAGYLWQASIALTGGLVGQVGSNNIVYANNLGPAAQINAVATGTVAWGLLSVYTSSYSYEIFATDAISVNDSTSVIRVNTLNAVNGQPLSITSISLTLGAQ